MISQTSCKLNQIYTAIATLKTRAEILTLYAQAKAIIDSNMSPKDKYALIFSEEISRKTWDWFRWLDLDTSYEEDVENFMTAFRDKAEEIMETDLSNLVGESDGD